MFEKELDHITDQLENRILFPEFLIENKIYYIRFQLELKFLTKWD